jgi:CelD/BcsL family acetyltransferase involved in cellulose biosynthesis
MTPKLSTRTLTAPAELRGIADEWGGLCERCLDATPFQRPEWLLSWIQVFAPEKIRMIEVRCEGVLVGLAPLLIYSRGSDHVLAFMGGGVSDYLDILIAPDREDEVPAALFAEIESLNGWNILDLTDLPAHSVLHRTSLAKLARSHESCSALLLPGTKEELLRLISKRQRANLRNAHSRLERAGSGQLELATGEALPEFLDDLFCLHTSRWSDSGQPGMLADEKTKAFHRHAAPRLLSKRILRLSRLRLEARTIAVSYSFLQHTTLYCYLQGFDPEFGFLSPGTQLMFSAIEGALSSGVRKFDFLRGEEDYKRHWRAQSENTYRIECPKSRMTSIGLIQGTAA